MKGVVVIPTYNERENIPMLVERILRLPGYRLDLFLSMMLRPTEQDDCWMISVGKSRA